MFAKFFLVIVGFLHCAYSFGATYDFSYSGRLVDSTGRPLEGPVALKASFFHSETGTTSILDVTTGLTQVPLSEGVFQIKLSLSDSDFQRVFPGVNQSVYIQITDLTHAPNQPYDRQQLTILPYAGKIPIDTSQFSWDSLGQLHFTASSSSDFSSAGPIGSTTPNTAIFTTVTTNKTSSATSGSVVNVTISPTYNQASGTAANTDLLINRTETAVGSGTQRLIDAQVGGATKFNVSNTGDAYFAGNVGIGTTSPSSKLTVIDSSSTSALTVGDGTRYITLGSNGNANWIGASGSHPLSLGSGNAAMAVYPSTGIVLGKAYPWTDPGSGNITIPSGSLGIGTSSPSELLHVQGASGTAGATPPTVKIQSTTDGTWTNGSSMARLDFASSDTSGNVGAGTKARISAYVEDGTVGSGGAVGLKFDTAGDSDFATRMTINRNGYVGIGTTSPAQKLHLNQGNILATNGNLWAAEGLVIGGNSSSTIGKWQMIVGDTSQNDLEIRTYRDLFFETDSGNGTAGTTRLAVKGTTGNVGIGITNPSQKLAVGASGDGSVAIANSWTTYSDQRLKKNISVIDSALEKISAVSGYFFHWKKGSDKSRQIGVMAQEVEKIFPELVKQGADGIKSVDYPKLAVPMLEAIKSLKGQVDQLKDENAKFKSENAIFKSENALFKSENALFKSETAALKSENEMMKIYLCDKDPSASFCARAH